MTYTVTLSDKIKDLKGNSLKEPFSWTFITKPPEPLTITEVSPSRDDRKIPNDIAIEISFSKPINQATLGEGVVTVVSEVGDRIQGTLSYREAQNRLQFTPKPTLDYGMTYTVTVST